MIVLFKFLYRNLKGYRLLVMLAIIITVTQVFVQIGMTFPLKFIPSKVQNPGNDPSCTFPFLNPILDKFDIPQIAPELQPLAPGQPPQPPELTQCPVSPGDPNPVLITSHHTVNGVIVFSIVMLLVFGALNAGLIYLDLFLANRIAQNLTARLRNRLFDHLQRLSLDWHGKQKKGDLVNRITGNISDIEKLVTDGLVDLLAGVLTLVGVITVMLLLSPTYTLISMAIIPAMFVMTLTYTRGIKAATKQATKATGQVSDVATEDINALTVIKVFTREEKESLRFGSYVDVTRRAGLRAGSLQAQFTPLVGFLVAIGLAAVIGVGGYVAAGNTFNLGLFTVQPLSVDIGLLVLFMTFLNLLYQPMRDLSKLTTLAGSAASGAERIQEVLDQAPEVLESQTPYTGPTRLRGDLSFENVVFGYVPERPVLKGINLQLPIGSKVALVGLSGGGKTTLVKLIPRFYEVSQGAIRIDGVDNRMYPLAVLRQNVSMVLQDSVLFEGTIADNISIGRPGATPQEVMEAARKANIHDVIVNELGGYQRLVREQGKDLSGGQRQRVAIARAILRDAPILILDEPTAALDVEAEAEVMRALDQLVIGRTVIMISHRLSTLGNVDEIIVLKEGQIAERGSYAALKKRGGVFATLLAEQNRYNLEKAGDKSMLRSAFVPLLDVPEQRPFQPPLPVPVFPPQPVIPVAQSGPSLSIPADRMSELPAEQTISVNSLRESVGRMQVQPGPRTAAVKVAPPRARVVIELDGKVVGERILDKPLLSVGRLSGNDVQVPSQRVSRKHAKIYEENGAWVIEDAESLNGLVYQGQRIDRLVLKNGDRVHVAPMAALQYQTAF
ncbi:MAG TPA: ABC transporter transmembrane domain-containing protein [Ktedonobacteraceae bacterium]|nr:ABC transporter transmembrane domain-containing protein [Ktedonobacteraceae bacterium]